LLLALRAMGCVAMQSNNLQNALLNVICSGGNFSEFETDAIAPFFFAVTFFDALHVLTCIVPESVILRYKDQVAYSTLHCADSELHILAVQLTLPCLFFHVKPLSH